jgi:hypothetical protein
MSNPYSGFSSPRIPPTPPPPPESSPPPFRRRSQPRMFQEALEGAVRRVGPLWRNLFGGAKRNVNSLWSKGKRLSQDLWLQGKRRPRTVALAGGAVALTLVGAIALSATGSGNSLCPPAKDGKTRFLLLMDEVAPATAGGEIEVRYDVCGLRSGTPYSGKIRLTQQLKPVAKKKKKKAPQPKPLTVAVAFKGKTDGRATRREQQMKLGPAKPGAYTLELIVADNQGRERKQVQKVTIK